MARGRPRADDPVMGKTVSLPRSLWAQVNAEALRSGVGLSALIRPLVEQAAECWQQGCETARGQRSLEKRRAENQGAA
jgi:hypothetical protein